MKIIDIRKAIQDLHQVNPEIRYKSCIERKQFSTGIISFKPKKHSDPREISHRDKDVVCHVLRGRGRLRINGRSIALKPGTICHIPKGIRHDFAAGKKGDLLLFYSLIKTG
ncbi:MAG TPA: cupin domain-containing protein [Candidatus Binatia bacterium]|jgi:mannose-6-phosphate isomerase-like protein (cupin superfamily)|nr:cupin domain-containing protein [Candidatus Binatia bacterium]